MPALPNVPQVIRFRVTWAVDADTLAMTTHFWKYTGSAPAAGDLSAFAGYLVTYGDTHFGPLCNTHVGMSECEATDLTSATSAQATAGTPWVGTRSGGMLSPATAAVVSHSIGRRYRGGKPRTYLPLGVTTDLTASGLWSTSFTSAVDSAWGGFTSDVSAMVSTGTSLGNICNVSYYHGSTVVISPTTGRARNVPTLRSIPVVDNITGHTVPVVIGSQRRRNRDA